MAAESFVKKNRVSDDDKVAADDAATFAEKREKGLPPFFLRRADKDGADGQGGKVGSSATPLTPRALG